jgi:uncharacterized protein YndB with AHSA1/START domain
MAVTETHVDATPERCFDVLRDARSFAYWVVGSRGIRGADPDWPAPGASFDHTAGVWPLKSKDHTVVEEVEPNRRLRLRAKARPFGTAFVTVTMEREGEGTRLRLKEEPADRVSRLLHNRFADRLLHARNEVSVERLRELAEGRTPIPHDGPGVARSRQEPPGRPPIAAAGFGLGAAAGLVGGMAMSVSTVVEMKLTGRRPSAVPAKAVKRMLAIRRLGRAGERRTTATAHFLVAALTGGAWGAIAARRPGPARGPALFAIAALPDAAIVPAMGLAEPPWRWSTADAGRTAVHHAVYAGVTYATFARLER